MKTEVKNTEINAQVVGQKLLKYFNDTSKHLFINKSGYFYKVLPVKVETNWYVITILFNGEKTYTKILKMNDFGYDVKRLIDEGKYDSAAKSEIHNHKMNLFPKSEFTSIPNFKLMREKMLEVIKCVQKSLNEDGLTKTKDKIGEILTDIKPKV